MPDNWKDGRGDRGEQTQMVSIAQNLVIAVNNLSNVVSATFPNWVTAPANSTASGVAGQVAFSGSATVSSYLYVCLTSGATGNATWGRLLLTTSF